MAINLHEKFAKKTADAFTIASLFKGKTNTEYSFEGNKKIKISTIVTTAPGDYTRTGANRFGTPSEVEDTVQVLDMTQDKSVSKTVDKGNFVQQDFMKTGAKVLALETKEQFIPMADKYFIGQLEKNAGKASVDAALTKANIVEKLAAAKTAFVNAKVSGDMYIALPASKYTMLRLAPEFMDLEKLGTQAIETGVIGKFMGMKVIEVPDDYFAATTNFVAFAKKSVLFPFQLETARVLTEAPGIDGCVVEIRQIYDAFVLNTLKGGVYLSKTA